MNRNEVIEKKNLFDLRPEQRIAKWKNHFVVEPRSRQDFGSILGLTKARAKAQFKASDEGHFEAGAKA